MKCTSCGEIIESEAPTACSKCGAALSTQGLGMLKIYRMGSPVGVAAGMGIYLNGAPYGHIGNKQTVPIALPYGSYKLHMTIGMNRKCNDLDFTLSPDNQLVCCKAHIKMGFIQNSVIIDPAAPGDIPD